ncbi:vWA domain-containing protein [Thalassolituus sp. UBA2009]|uniref:vWA domain-containing protein n=1 Tax=Thalassolituus sp. UBA2009 TaxID=1947658 RepID=UPI00257D59E1|nr:VWA domain-containing protein [Thalassolituus sp. UBA2009]
MEFHWPWAFFLLPLPWIIRAFLPPLKVEQAALKVPSLSPWRLQNSKGGERQTQQNLSGWLLPLALWLALVGALSRPYHSGEIVQMPVSGRDLMLAVDISQSMEIEDMRLNNKPANRLAVVKQVVSNFIEQRSGDRMGLILFGSNAYLQAPLTFDARTVSTFLNEAQIGLAGKKTAIGDAIGLTIKRLQDNPEQSRVMILLTDGANTAGEIEPLKAAELAASNGVKIYTIGLGADVMEVSSFFGTRKVNPSRDLDENALREIARQTGGAFFRARDTEELQKIYQFIDDLEPTEKDPEIYRPQQSLYHWPLAIAFIISLLIALQQRFNRMPGGGRH